MAKFAVILPAAGRSSRFGETHRKKPFVNLQNRAIWLRAIDPFLSRDDVAQAIVVIGADELDWFKETYRANLAFMNVDVVVGGDERSDSVLNGLKAVREEIDYVAIHDAARPLVSKPLIDAVFAASMVHGAALPATPIASTIKRVAAEVVLETVDRSGLYAAQTPQVFRKSLLIEAYDRRGGFQPTDECQLIERLGRKIHVVSGASENIKITTQGDLRVAEALLGLQFQAAQPLRVHPFSDEPPILFS